MAWQRAAACDEVIKKIFFSTKPFQYFMISRLTSSHFVIRSMYFRIPSIFSCLTSIKVTFGNIRLGNIRFDKPVRMVD